MLLIAGELNSEKNILVLVAVAANVVVIVVNEFISTLLFLKRSMIYEDDRKNGLHNQFVPRYINRSYSFYQTVHVVRTVYITRSIPFMHREKYWIQLFGFGLI